MNVEKYTRCFPRKSSKSRLKTEKYVEAWSQVENVLIQSFEFDQDWS